MRPFHCPSLVRSITIYINYIGLLKFIYDYYKYMNYVSWQNSSFQLFRKNEKFHGTFDFMKRSVVTYTKYPENRERCRVKSMGCHISVKSPSNPAICIYFPPCVFFCRRLTMKNSTRYSVFAISYADGREKKIL